MAHCNYQGLLGSYKHSNAISGHHLKLDYLREALCFTNSPDIFCMTESKLSPKILDSELIISGYETFCHDRTRKGGGIFIYCRQTLRPKAIIDPKPTIEALAIKLQLTHGNSMIICGVYRPPSSDVKWIKEFF